MSDTVVSDMETPVDASVAAPAAGERSESWLADGGANGSHGIEEAQLLLRAQAGAVGHLA